MSISHNVIIASNWLQTYKLIIKFTLILWLTHKIPQPGLHNLPVYNPSKGQLLDPSYWRKCLGNYLLWWL